MLITVLILAIQTHALVEPCPPCPPPSEKQLHVEPCNPDEGCVETWSWKEPELGVS